MPETPRSALVRQVSEFHGKLIEVCTDEMQPESLRFQARDVIAAVEPLFDELVRLEPDWPWWITDQPTP